MRILFMIIGLLMPLASFCHNYFHEGMKWESLILIPDIETKYITNIAYLEKAGENTFSLYDKVEEPGYEPSFIAYIKTENEKVFFRLDNDPSEPWYLMYDFGMKPGDSNIFFTPYRNYDDQPPFSAEITCVGYETDSEDSKWERMLLEVQHDENGESEPEAGYWIKGLTSPLGINYNIEFGYTGLLLFQYRVFENDELIYCLGSDPRAGINENNNYNDAIKIISSENSVEILSQENNTVEMYSADGNLISRAQLQKNIPTILPVQQKGLIILKIGNRTYKMLF